MSLRENIKMRFAISLIATTAALALASPALAQDARPVTYHGSLQGCGNGQLMPLRLQAGRRYTISANSTAFDPVLKITRRGNAAALASDDDSGEGNNARLSFSPTEPGDYLACVTAFSGDGGGAFDLIVEPAAPLPPMTEARPTGTENQVWQIYEGALTQGDGEDGGKRYDDVLINIPAGHRAFISAESSAFDPMVKVYRADQRGGEPVASDDDSGGSLSAFLMYAPDEGGSFVVRVTSFAADGQGAYRLRVSTQAIPQRQEQQPDDASE
jgi:hypothetical protein